MRTPRSRLRRHLSYANVMASIAVFVALGGVGYAATTISGNKIIKGTIGAGKLKNGTLTSTQVKQNALTGAVIDESSLTIVPAAQTATSATTATTAGSANAAKTATTAEHAFSADTAGKATEATSADTALTAESADTIEGFSAEQLQVTCPAATTLFGGMCWDDAVRSSRNWILASIDCGKAGGRLPSLSELIAYVDQDGAQVAGENWSGDVSEFEPGPGGDEVVLTRTETTTGAVKSLSLSLGYRCLFYRAN